jgi:uncharacterized phage infection (PIP) family protein YhgE
MKPGLLAIVMLLGLGLVAPAIAQDDTKTETPAKDEAPAPTPEAAPTPADAPAPAAAAAADAAPAPAAAPAADAAPAKELSGCAKSFSPLADTYKSAYDDLQKWIGQIDAETAAAGDQVQKLQTQIKDNETAITQAKFNKDNAKVKELQKQNKQLWDEFNKAQKAQSDACAKFVKEAPQRVKQYADATNKALGALKSPSK